MSVAWLIAALVLFGPTGVHESEAELWPMTLRAATRIALDNSEFARVVASDGVGTTGGCFETHRVCNVEPGPEISIGPECGVHEKRANFVIMGVNADRSHSRFKADAMALVRSVEQQYWNLSQAHAAFRSADLAATAAHDLFDETPAYLVQCCDQWNDVADAATTAKRLDVDVLRRMSDVNTAERQLRGALGLPAENKRRIIPSTQPTEQQIVFDWNTCLSEMMEEQPDILHQQTIVRLAELQLLLARNQLIPRLDECTVFRLEGMGQILETPQEMAVAQFRKFLHPLHDLTSGCGDLGKDMSDYRNFLTRQVGLTIQSPPHGVALRSPLANTRAAQYVLLRSRGLERQVIQKTTHALARLFLEVDANYRQYSTGKRLRATAAQRLDSQRADYGEGRITIDRVVDAVSQYATAVASESHHLATYNIMLAALSEAKGTLLADREIGVRLGVGP
jgi:hypothetical protein